MMQLSKKKIASRYPGFIGIGAQKVATTWAYEQLNAHPQVFVSESKELNFFCSDRSDTWYEEQFQLAPERSVIGEVSPSYLVRAVVPKRMHDLVPDSKLSCILRNPAEHAFSQWKIARQIGNIPKEISFIEAFRQNYQRMAERGNYLKLISQFEVYYPIGGLLLILFFDDIQSCPRDVTRKLYYFLEIDPVFESPSINDVVGGATDPAVIID